MQTTKLVNAGMRVFKDKVMHIKQLKHSFLRNYWVILTKFVCKPLGTMKFIHKNDAGHITKTAVMPIYDSHFGNLISWISGPIWTKLGLKHGRPRLIILCSNDIPGLTLTYLTTRSNFAA